jgi:hypothetical protein
MHAKLTLCVASRRALEEAEVFFLRADRARDSVTDHMNEMARGKVSVSSYLKTGGSSAHAELDVKGQYRDVCTALIAAVTKVHESGSDEQPAPRLTAPVSGLISKPTPEPERAKTITETVED